MTKSKKIFKKAQRSTLIWTSIAYNGNMSIYIKAQLQGKVYEVKKGTH